MNNARRKTIADTLSNLQTALAELETVRDEEQEAFGNMPEGLQGSDKGQEMEQNASTLSDAYDSLEEVIENEIT